MNRREQLLQFFPEGHTDYSLTRIDEIEYVIRHGGYRDVQRNLHGIGRTPKGCAARDKLFKQLANMLCSYFTVKPFETQAQFDKWHKNICNTLIIPAFQPFVSNGMAYGKAQKILNISFKHVFCFCDAINKQEHLQFCHTPIDQKVLKWYRCTIVPKYHICWTKMDESTYFTIQKNIREYLLSPANLLLKDKDGAFTPLECDFILWKQP